MANRISPIENDPFSLVADAFGELWPNTPFPRVEFVEGLHIDDDAPWAETHIPDDDFPDIRISIDVEATVRGAVELLAHELAHVAMYHLGLDHEENHGPFWQEFFEAINQTHKAKAEGGNGTN